MTDDPRQRDLAREDDEMTSEVPPAARPGDDVPDDVRDGDVGQHEEDQ